MLRKNCVIYVRVSTEEQTKGYSLNGQERIDRDFAASQGYEVINVFREEGISAKDLNRPQLQAMMNWVREHAAEVDAVIFWKWERISRGTEYDYAVLGKFFEECKVIPLSATECNEDSPEGELLRWITKGTALYERRKISQRTSMGMEQKAREGIRPCKAPIGYKNYTMPDEKKIIVIDEATAPFIRKAFELYATGNYSLKRLGETLYYDGFKHPKTGEKFPPRKFEWMLKNSFYIGTVEYKGNYYEGKHEPLISKELFYQVQGMFGWKKPKSHNIFFPYTNMIKCIKCGEHKLSAEMQRGAHNSGEYIYYRCRCGCKAIKQEELDKVFIDMLEDIYIPPAEIEAMKNEARELLQAIKDYENSLESPVEMQKKIETIKSRIQKSYSDKLDGKLPYGMTEEDWNGMMASWASELNQLEIKLTERMEKSKVLYNRLSLIMSFCNQLPELFRLATPEIKREIVQTCIRTLTYDGETLNIELFPIFYKLKYWKNVKNGALNGLISEPQQPDIFSIMDTEECQFLYGRIEKLLAA